ncbi:MobF family relaxase [Sphingobium chungbukense]|uniref:DNA relaxase n=1 Tax=Sphingobium chungbukense TaxID=56193 RepID=A0A0M3ARG1_9SPHN|nr:MobF family relaxase [Sphingobium chungbukense]KKW92503.1 DNA relaxase [Sphingobium chungbukense]
MIHPRRLKGTPANIARYYTVGDYYTKGDAEHSEWGGAIARDLGIEGMPVEPDLFKSLLAGEIAGQQLGRRLSDGAIDHHPGWDFAVNAPKSVSIMALLTGDERIIAAHEKAVTAALSYLEEHAGLRRREEGEIVHETTERLIFARFTEHASRELDPHLHTHVVVMNMTNHEPEARMASLESRAMFAAQMAAGQVYRNALAFDLREQGWQIADDPRTGLFEIGGVPYDLIRTFSQRAEQIDDHAREHGLTGQAARRESFYATRRAKEKTDLPTLHQNWERRSHSHAVTLDQLREEASSREAGPLEVDAATAARAALFGIKQAETREAVNDYGAILRAGLAAHVGEVRAQDVRPQLDAHEERRKLFATHEQTGDQILTRGRTTRKTARAEQALTRHILLGMDDARPIASADRLLAVLEGAGLKPEQEQALVEIATSRDRLTAVHGVAGAGKSTLVGVLKVAAEPGTRFTALAPTSSAAGNLGDSARITSRTVASLLASGGRGLTPSDVLVLDEAGQLGTRQALRVLEISRASGARVIFLGDNRQTGAVEQGKAFWLMQRLGLPTAQLTESVRQETRAMKMAVTAARSGDYAASLTALDKVASGGTAEDLAKGLVRDWTRLSADSRATTNILVLDNATRLIVNSRIRDALKVEGALAAEEHRLSILTPAGMTDAEKQAARFYSGGQVVTFGQDLGKSGIARDTEYRVLGMGRDPNGRQMVRLVDEQGRVIRWDPRLTRARTVNVFNREERNLATGDRIQWRLVNKDLDLKNAERGTVERIDQGVATIRWDRGGRVSQVDLATHKTWDHGYAETVYSAQSKTYARAYVLAPVASPLVTGQNYYTAITRARFGVKLWTEDPEKLAEKLMARSGEKTSSLEGLGRLDKDARAPFDERHGDRLRADREQQRSDREARKDRALSRRLPDEPRNLGEHLAARAGRIAASLDRYLQSLSEPRRGDTDRASEAAQPAFRGAEHTPNKGPER